MALSCGDGMKINQKTVIIFKAALSKFYKAANPKQKQPKKEKGRTNPSPNSVHHCYPDYLSQVACHFDVVPGVVIEFPIDGLHDGLKGP